ncbi:hypothetical protein BC937DRAFT_93582 [Endogone sp. FLAS-F59071]|nr:hypothetical protein BC937DRAFT_93582 [Endogone sp. FLAS-F59071]|eukprot:RUS14596.1 hypothetical protein BC937DRAFT_93582 [Endogone sp. FLAS-F59071]
MTHCHPFGSNNSQSMPAMDTNPQYLEVLKSINEKLRLTLEQTPHRSKNAEQLAYYQNMGQFLTGIATFASGLIFQALSSVTPGSSPDVEARLAWGFFAVNLSIIIGLVGFFGVPGRHDPEDDVQLFEVAFFRGALYVMLVSVIVGFGLMYSVILLWGQESAAIAGWASFATVLLAWIASLAIRLALGGTFSKLTLG